ncbi:hypothetical protein [Alkalinema sp. FACHB-956]|uniref:hypothetical protein n=1 Tax=Alkalinema sp. FACHB-956 TaxID=2692768 RepID=UPI001682FFF2|nr:hypothetical protein [Alkalinema sp. FACHB-956]MBD2329939.1 hypothetical protein [Alkalinema sp. FACHB-956]
MHAKGKYRRINSEDRQIVWVRFNDDTTPWLCVSVPTTETSTGLHHNSPPYDDQQAILDHRQSLSLDFQSFDDLDWQSLDKGFLRLSIVEVVPQFTAHVDLLIGNALSGELFVRKEEVSKGKNKSIKKIEKLVEIYEEQYSEEGVFKLMSVIDKYFEAIASKVLEEYNKRQDNSKRRNRKSHSRHIELENYETRLI